MEPSSIARYLPSIYRVEIPCRPLRAEAREEEPRIRARATKPLLTAIALGILVAIAASPPAILAVGSGGGGPTISLVPGPDSSPTCASFPCGSVSVSADGRPLITLSLGRAAPHNPQPETYFTDLLLVTNPTGKAVTVRSVSVTAVTEARPGDIGALSVFYCATQTDSPPDGCERAFTILGTCGGVVYRGGYTFQQGGAWFLEFAGFAGPGAQVGDAISFMIQVVVQ